MRALACIVVAAATLIVPCISHSSEIVYPLQSDEFLFVGGREYRELVIREDDQSGNVYVNDVLVYERPEVKANETSIVDDPFHTKLDDSPFMRDRLSKGNSYAQAIADYESKVREFSKMLADCCVRMHNGASSMGDSKAEIETWLSKAENDGIVETIDYRGEAITYRFWSSVAPYTVAAGLVIDSAGLGLDDFVSRFRDPFVAKSGPQLLVISENGGAQRFSGVAVDRVLLQISEMQKTGAYVDGPIREVLAKKFGFASTRR